MRITFLKGAGAIAFLAACAFTTPIARADNGQQNNDITGSWLATSTVINPPPGFAPGFEAVLSFTKEDSVIVTANLPGVTIGQGAWKRTGHDRYTFTFYFYRMDLDLSAAVEDARGGKSPARP